MQDENKIGEGMESNGIKQWLQDNMRIILSVIIVVLIAGGIYSYSKRTEAPVADNSNSELSVNLDDVKADSTTTKATDKKNIVASSQETENSFIETAGKGDSRTVLARRALANYLEKNTDSTLTAEHKIYIEDFLRKNIPQKSVHVGTSAEFSKDLIQKAIGKSKTLNERQLKNLHKYAVRVPSLS